MRYLLPLILLGCSTGADDNFEFDVDDWQPRDSADARPDAPPAPMTLEVTGGAWGAYTNFRINDASEESVVRVARSPFRSPDGPCYPMLGGQCFELAAPIYYMTSIYTDRDGSGVTRVPTAAWFPEGGVCFQAVDYNDGGDSAELSNSACIFVGPDDDGDGVANAGDICPGFDDNLDIDGDGQPNDCDPCPTDPEDADTDRDGICNVDDDCVRAEGFVDTDGDRTCDADDLCPEDPTDSCAGLVAAEGRNGAGNGFYQIDLEAGTVTLLGSGSSYTALAYSETGELYGYEAGGRENLLFVNPLTGENEEGPVTGYAHWSGMTVLDGLVYHWSERGDNLHTMDADSGEESDGFLYGSSYNHCIAADTDGNMYRIAGSSLYALDYEGGFETSLGGISGITDTGGGSSCTFHDGQLLFLTGGRGIYSKLYTIDIPSLTATDTGIEMPSNNFDALASPTP